MRWAPILKNKILIDREDSYRGKYEPNFRKGHINLIFVKGERD